MYFPPTNPSLELPASTTSIICRSITNFKNTIQHSVRTSSVDDTGALIHEDLGPGPYLEVSPESLTEDTAPKPTTGFQDNPDLLNLLDHIARILGEQFIEAMKQVSEE
jgi:hypothetical protein